MKKVKKPDLIGYDLYNKCVERTRDEKEYYESISLQILQAEEEYTLKAPVNEFHQIANYKPTVDKKSMKYLYESRMVPEGSPGRDEYVELRAIKSEICPYCNQRKHDTLDHFLPKAEYPALAILPLNLVPSCGKCNKDKLVYTPTHASETTFHPYYDDFGDGIWLEAEVVQSTPMALKFKVVHPEGWPLINFQRTSKHFEAYYLASLYSSHSGQQLTTMKMRLSRLFNAGSAKAIKDYLYEELLSLDAVDPNHWKAAMMRALYNSDWFHQGGFEFIEDLSEDEE